MPSGIYKRSLQYKNNLSKKFSGEGNPFYGKKHSQSTKNKIGKINKKRFRNPKNHPMFGKKHSKETRLKMSQNHDNRIGKNHPLWKDIGSIVMNPNSSGYKQIKISNHKWGALHIYLVEKYIGRKLKKGWIIHHIDGNKLNNKLKNLYLFKNIGWHSIFEKLVKMKIINRFILKSNVKLFRKIK
jgi:hypothetical protein